MPDIAEAQTMLDAAVIEIDRENSGVLGQPMRLCETGEPYITLLSRGIRDEESQAHLIGYENPINAVKGWVSQFRSYRFMFKPTSVKLYWRTRPTLIEMEDGCWMVRSRLVLHEQQEMANA